MRVRRNRIIDNIRLQLRVILIRDNISHWRLLPHRPRTGKSKRRILLFLNEQLSFLQRFLHLFCWAVYQCLGIFVCKGIRPCLDKCPILQRRLVPLCGFYTALSRIRLCTWLWRFCRIRQEACRQGNARRYSGDHNPEGWFPVIQHRFYSRLYPDLSKSKRISKYYFSMKAARQERICVCFLFRHAICRDYPFIACQLRILAEKSIG